MRARWFVVPLLVAVAACGREASPTVAPPLPSSTSTVSPGPVPDDTTPGGMPSPPAHETTVTRPATTIAPTKVPPASMRADGPTGSAAPLYLRPTPATQLVLEVSSGDGLGPSQMTLDHVVDVLRRVSGKPVTVRAGRAVPTRDSWTAADVRAAADAATLTATSGSHAVLHVLFVHGRWSADDHVLGISVRGDVAAIFEDQVAGASDPLIGSDAIEVAVTTHEVGHLLGLVDLYLDTGRDDPQHPGHSTDRSSVMYWAVESTLVTDLLAGGPPRDFDSADLADLAAIRGGA